MNAQLSFADRNMAGILLILSSVLTGVGVILWTGRNMWKWPAAEAASFLGWERGLMIAGIVAAVLGLSLLESILRAAGESVAARLGLSAFLVGAVLGIVAETYEISRQGSFYPAVVVYVVLAFLGQAAFGVSILRTGLLPVWIGWTTVIWNLAWLVVLPIITPSDIYYPVLHYLAPLLIGIALLVKR